MEEPASPGPTSTAQQRRKKRTALPRRAPASVPVKINLQMPRKPLRSSRKRCSRPQPLLKTRMRSPPAAFRAPPAHSHAQKKGRRNLRQPFNRQFKQNLEVVVLGPVLPVEETGPNGFVSVLYRLCIRPCSPCTGTYCFLSLLYRFVSGHGLSRAVQLVVVFQAEMRNQVFSLNMPQGIF